MKSPSFIRVELIECRAKLRIVEAKHDTLSQIDMLSGEGSKLREDINLTKGVIKALEWIENDNDNESIL